MFPIDSMPLMIIFSTANIHESALLVKRFFLTLVAIIVKRAAGLFRVSLGSGRIPLRGISRGLEATPMRRI